MNVGELAWSYSFISQADRQLLVDAKQAQLQVGREFDRHCTSWEPHRGVRQPLTPTPPDIEEPSIPHILAGMCLVLKPPGWEVDTEGHSGIRHLSGFIQEVLPPDRRVVAFRPDFSFGFIHRLDTPSSGLILTATSFEGYCCLEWQMYTYTIARQYFVLGHGAARLSKMDVEHRILDTPTARVAENGRPALSHIRFLSDIGFEDGTGMEMFCSVAICIYTGRRHQIRVHMRHAECASVADHRYHPDPSIFLRSYLCTPLRLQVSMGPFMDVHKEH